jgi:hypothetical protein
VQRPDLVELFLLHPFLHPAKEGCSPPVAMHDAPTNDLLTFKNRTLTGDTFK